LCDYKIHHHVSFAHQDKLQYDQDTVLQPQTSSPIGTHETRYESSVWTRQASPVPKFPKHASHAPDFARALNTYLLSLAQSMPHFYPSLFPC
jgi:hypothetical protein